MPGLNGTNVFNHIDRFTNSLSASRDVRPAPSDLLVIPFFENGGERSPYTNPNARGAIFGLQASSTSGEIRWATRESLAYLGRVSQTLLSAGDTVAVGGGLSQDRFFCSSMPTAWARCFIASTRLMLACTASLSF